VFPQAIGIAATWDDSLVFRMATVISDEARAKYLRGGSAPSMNHLSTRSLRSWARILVVGVVLSVMGCQMTSRGAQFQVRSPHETNVRFTNALREDDSVYNVIDFDYLYNGGGVAIADVNNDGLSDIYLAGNMVSSRLYLNRGHLRFDDVTDLAGVGTLVWVSGVTVVDINQDGLPDLYLSVAGPGPASTRANLLFVNRGPRADGIPRFVEAAAKYRIADTGYSTHAAFLDYDRDGDLDLYVLTNALEDDNQNVLRLKRVHGEASSTDRLYRKNADGTFTDASRAAGIQIEGYGLGVVSGDLNGDGWPDVYVANDFVSNDLLWINNRDGTFTNRAGKYLKHQSYAGMGADVADYNNDGLPDIVVLDMLPADNFRRKMTVPDGDDDRFRRALHLGYEPQYTRNTLQLNNGPGPDGNPSFSDIGQLAGVAATDWSWAPLLADFDNDGWKDLFITTGYPRDVTNFDYLVEVQRPIGAVSRAERHRRALVELRALPALKLASYMFRNNGDLTFTDRTRAWGLSVSRYATGAAYADLDGDGDLDLVVNNIDDVASVFENRAAQLAPDRHYLRLAFRGSPGNREGYGTQVTIQAGGMTQYLEYAPVRGYLSTVEPYLHFGLGAARRVDSTRVWWPDGTCQVLTGVAADQVITVDHRDAQACPAPRPATDTWLFEGAAGHGLALKHEMRDVPDFQVTPLLPHTFSQGGPGIAVGDLDGDGREDVYIGADRGHEKGTYFQVQPGRFERRVLEGPRDVQDMGALIFDADGDGDNDLLIANGGSFITSDPATYQSRLYLNDGWGHLRLAAGALPPMGSSSSVVVAADYDRDGDLDLCIGGRVIPGHYPLPPGSFLLRNDTKPGEPVRFSDVTDSLAPGLGDVGLVTDALWTDFDQDGQIDLVVVGEWMPITFFRNRHGRFENVTALTGLGATNGWWNSLVAGDFDGDADTDYLVGNLGLNSTYRATEQEPLRVYAADFDRNGTLDPVLFTSVQGTSYPVASRDLMIAQMIGIRGRFPRYADYAAATEERTLSPEERAHAYAARAVTLASSYVENLGGGKFALRPLPLTAQIAPTFGMLAGDFDADGNLDVLLVGNSYAESAQAGRGDASIGGVLLGDGTGHFRYVSGAASGFYVPGDAKAVAELVLDDAHSLVLVTQNDDSLKVFAPLSRGPMRNLRLDALDSYAVLTLADGTTRRQELYYGSTYLSQSSRFLKVPDEVTGVTVYDSRGRSRDLVLRPGVAQSRTVRDGKGR